MKCGFIPGGINWKNTGGNPLIFNGIDISKYSYFKYKLNIRRHVKICRVKFNEKLRSNFILH